MTSMPPVITTPKRKIFLPFDKNKMILLLVILISTALSASNTQAGSASFCANDEPYAPDGIVLRMGGEYYRACGNWVEEGLPWRLFILGMNPSIVPHLFSPLSSTRLEVVERIDEDNRMRRLQRGLSRRGTKLFGDVKYQSYESEALGANGKPNAGAYLYTTVGEGDDIPSHLVTCAEIGGDDKSDALYCRVSVSKGAVTANLALIGSNESGFSFIDHFSDFAQDIERVLDIANVTNDLDDVKTFLNVIE